MSDHISIVTQRRPVYLASKSTNIACATSLTTKYATSTLPATDATSSGGSVVLGGSINYLKIQPRWETGASSPLVRVIGWSRCKDTGFYVPHLLANLSCTLNGAGGVTINGTSLLGCSAISNTIGDAKIYNSTSFSTEAFVVVDTLGFELIELSFRATTTSKACNAFLSEV